MKKIILSFLLMLCLAFSFASCKKDDAPQTENTPTPSVSEDVKDEKPSEEKENTKPNEEKKETSSKSNENVSAEEFENLVETFNSTDNEEKKEETRKKIEEILKQVEAQQ